MIKLGGLRAVSGLVDEPDEITLYLLAIRNGTYFTVYFILRKKKELFGILTLLLKTKL